MIVLSEGDNILKQPVYLKNESINAQNVYVVTPDKQVVKMSLKAAISAARATDSDLIQIGINKKEDIPVCKIMEWGKFQFELKQKQKYIKKQSSKKQKTKEIQITPSTSEHDLRIKASKIIRIVNNGDAVVIIVRVKGREYNYVKDHHEVLIKLIEMVKAETGVDFQIIIQEHNICAKMVNAAT